MPETIKRTTETKRTQFTYDFPTIPLHSHLYPGTTPCFYPNFTNELPGMVPNYPANRGNNIIISYTIEGNPSGEQTA